MTRAAVVRLALVACLLPLAALAAQSGAPTVTDQGNSRVYDYGAVADDFVASLPTDLPPGIFAVISMTKKAPGSLIRMSVLPFSMAALSRTDVDYRNNMDQQTMLIADVAEAHDARGLVLRCEYLAPPGQKDAVTWSWYRKRPAVADPAMLQGHIPDHPMLEIRPAAVICPLTAAAAAP